MIEFGVPQTELSELQRRLVFLKVGILIIVGLLVFRLWQLQVHEGPYYRDLSLNNRTRAIVLQPARGLVYDREGVLLANNVPSFNLYVELEDVKDRGRLGEALERILQLSPTELTEKLEARGAMTRVRLRGGLTLKEAALIESNRLELPGVVIQPEYQRNYPLGAYASHLLGYVSQVSEEQLAQPEFEGLHQGSIVGQYGIEREYDTVLRGKAGRKIIEVDALGHENQSLAVEKPQAGDDVYLTIDFRLQQRAEVLLGEEAGAIVALSPNNGEILALASKPGFDLNAVSRGLSAREWQSILHDSRHPLTNRAIQGQYPPGSTFKIVMAAAALESHAIDFLDSIRCGGGYRFGRRTFRDWKRGGHGIVNLRKALAQSCDVYFYKIGNRMGIETIASYSKDFGLGQKTGIDLPSEVEGIIPTPEWKKRVKGEPWYPGETISVSIGQGFVTVTPIQMARVIGAIANNGVYYAPRLIRAVGRREGGGLEEWPVPDGRKVSISPRSLRGIQDGLRKVVQEGTGRRSQSSLVSIAGKTGTSQVVALRSGPEKDIPKEHRDHAWFVAYAPFEDPKIAVAVLVEHMGHGGSAAAPLAKDLIETFVRLHGDPSENPKGKGSTTSGANHQRSGQGHG